MISQSEPARAPAARPQASPRVWAALLIVYFFWGSTYLGIRILVRSAPPLFAAGLRFIVAALLLTGYLLARGHRGHTGPPPGPPQEPGPRSEAGGPAVRGERAWLRPLAVPGRPAWCAVGVGILLGEQITWQILAGGVIAIGGVALIIATETQRLGPRPWPGRCDRVVKARERRAGAIACRGANVQRPDARGRWVNAD